MTKVSASPLEGFVPAMRVFNLPYLFRDREHYLQVLDSDIGEELLLAPTVARLRGLGYYDAGSRSFYTTDRQVETPADLDGLKIRVQESQTAMQMVAALGGAPTPISFGELYSALQQGVVDGAENNPPSFYTSGHYEVARYYSLDEHTAVPDLVLISTRVWDSLALRQQQWLQQAVDESVGFQRELWQRDTEAALAAVAADGVEILRPDKAAFQRNVEAMLAEYGASDLGPLIRRIQAW
jgi:tripartite ATP-independent transporter DctP family solute receptor